MKTYIYAMLFNMSFGGISVVVQRNEICDILATASFYICRPVQHARGEMAIHEAHQAHLTVA